MGTLVDFIQSKNQKRNINARHSEKSEEVIRISKLYGADYWDGDRKFGYGGYSYDGRWKKVAHRLSKHYGLADGAKILDVGCGKGFLVHDLCAHEKRFDAYGLDISEYALQDCFDTDVGRLHLGNAKKLPFPDNSFDLVVSFNTIHNLTRREAISALSEIQRVTNSSCFVQVDSYETENQRDIFLDWVLTAEYHDFPDGWLKTFEEAGYVGDYFWTIVE